MVSPRPTCAQLAPSCTRSRSSCQRDRAKHLDTDTTRCQPTRTCSPDETSSADLRRKYLALLDRLPDADVWQEIWRLFVTHSWFQSKLEMCANIALRSSGLSPQWVDDVMQEVIVKLADKLHRVPDLRLDRGRAAGQFGGWLYTILLRDCQQAIRTLRRLHCRTVQLYDAYIVNDRTPRVDAQLDFEDALRRLDDPELTVIVLYGQGYAVREIAEALGFSSSKTYRTLNRGMSRLEKRLGNPERDHEHHVRRSPR